LCKVSHTYDGIKMSESLIKNGLMAYMYARVYMLILAYIPEGK